MYQYASKGKRGIEDNFKGLFLLVMPEYALGRFRVMFENLQIWQYHSSIILMSRELGSQVEMWVLGSQLDS